tara:strand:- start:39355 stop:39621 length:267 start_codon:yes stop_codon:yes gene_type:complete
MTTIDKTSQYYAHREATQNVKDIVEKYSLELKAFHNTPDGYVKYITKTPAWRKTKEKYDGAKASLKQLNVITIRHFSDEHLAYKELVQ